jgi:hypothetical protein
VRRFLAIVAVALMIAGALAARGALDDSDGDGGDGEDAATGGDAATLLCDLTLQAVCDRLETEFDNLATRTVDVETARGIFESTDLTTAPDQPDGWLTVSPLPAQVDETRERAGTRPVFDDHEAAGRSPLVVVIWKDRAAALEAACGGPIDWTCIGDNADVAWSDLGGDPRWGRLTPGIDEPSVISTGLLVTGQAAVSFMGSADFASNDFGPAGLELWIGGLLDAVPPPPPAGTTVLDRMLSAGPSSYDLVGATEAAALDRLAVSRDKDDLVVLYPAPMATADVVLASVVDAPGARRLAEIGESRQLTEALQAAGFRTPNQSPPDTAPLDPALSDDNGLPRPGVLDALDHT